MTAHNRAHNRSLLGNILERRDALARQISERQARSRIATMVVVTILEIAVAGLVLSHAPDIEAGIAPVLFLLCFCFVFNASSIHICRRTISLAHSA